MAAFYAACLVGLAAFTFIAAAQSTLLELLGVADDDKGSVSGHLGVAAELVLLVAVGVFGSLSDRIGRRPVFAVGFVVVALGLVLAPFAGSVLALGVFRVVFALGAAAVTGMISTVVSDFAVDKDRGQGSRPARRHERRRRRADGLRAGVAPPAVRDGRPRRGRRRAGWPTPS